MSYLSSIVQSNNCSAPNQCLGASDIFMAKKNATQFLKGLDTICEITKVLFSRGLHEECCMESNCCNREELAEHGIYNMSPIEVRCIDLLWNLCDCVIYEGRKTDQKAKGIDTEPQKKRRKLII